VPVNTVSIPLRQFPRTWYNAAVCSHHKRLCVSDDPRTRDELLGAMKQGACPLCVLVERAERKAVDHFLYDQVNDISRRDALRASRGLCLEHTEMLAEGRSALGVAILSRDILRAMTAELETPDGGGAMLGWLRGRPGSGAQLAERVGPHAGCPMCAERPRIEAPLIAGLLRNLRDPSFAEAFDAAGGLCRVHLANTLRAADSTDARGLAARQVAVWRRLEAELDEFIRKHDHRFQGEIFEGERDVWRRALRATSGWYDEK
jgi:hypothetical protein